MTIFMDSFQYTSAQIPRKWTNLSTVGGAGSLTQSNSDLYGRELSLRDLNSVLEKALGESATWSMSFSFKSPSTPSDPARTNASRSIVKFKDGVTTQVSIYLAAGRFLHIRRGDVTHTGTTYASIGGVALTGGESTTPLEPDVWYQIEIKATFSASLGANAFQVRITGPSVDETLTLTAGQSTLTTANAWSSRIELRGENSGSWGRGVLYGGMYIDNSQAALLGNVRVAGLFPNANGNSSQWVGSDGNSTDNYLLVDEATPNDDTDYVATATNSQIDLYGMTNLPTPAVSVLSVQWNGQCRKTDAADAYVEPTYRIDGTNYIDSPIMVGNAYHNIFKAVAVSPDTTAAWTQAEIEAMEVGFRSSL
jgi:hypothetical protein